VWHILKNSHNIWITDYSFAGAVSKENMDEFWSYVIKVCRRQYRDLIEKA
jgi:hypothetical protein